MNSPCDSDASGSSMRVPDIRPFISLHASFVAEKLKPVNDELLDTATCRDRKLSLVELMVNDSQSGMKFEDAYDKKDLIGEGGYALVYRCKHKKNGSYYAVKEVFHSEYDGANSLKNEIKALKCVKENFCMIVRLHDIFVDVDRTYLVMEELRGGDLLDRIAAKGKYTEAKARKVIRSLLEAIRFCHKKRIAHRDVKPENILLVNEFDDTTIKLCDFGCAKFVEAPCALRTMAGSPQYAAPEVFEHTKKGGYGEECDLWSAGVVLYVLLSANTPFSGSVFDISRQVTEGDWAFDEKYFHKISQPPKDLISNLMTVDAAKRYSADQALDCRWLRRPELNRASSEEYLLKQKKKLPMTIVNESFHHSLPAFAFDYIEGDLDDQLVLSPPLPMEWIPESPSILKVKREMPVTTRRLNAKPRLGGRIGAKPKLGDSFSILSFGNDSLVLSDDELQTSSSKSLEMSHESFRFHCSIPDLLGEVDETENGD